jgi:hypothetical protein
MFFNDGYMLHLTFTRVLPFGQFIQFIPKISAVILIIQLHLSWKYFFFNAMLKTTQLNNLYTRRHRRPVGA